MKKSQLCMNGWSLMRGADYKDVISRRILVLWKEDYGRWS